MKILFYISTISGGGAARVITNLANQFVNDNHECILATSFCDEKEYIYDDRVKRLHLVEKPILKKIKKNFILTKKLRELLKQEKPDIVLSFLPEPNFRTLIATRGLKVKSIISIRNDPNKEYGNKLFRFLAKILYKKADGIVFQTHEAKEWFSIEIQRKSKVIFNQVDTKFFEVQRDSNVKDIVAIGRLTSQKNQKLLIEAFSIIADKVKDNLLIYGDGESKEDLQNLIKKKGLNKRVFLLGSTKEVQSVLKKAKVFVLSSDYEGMPNVLMEAMAVGVPCISTDCPCGGPHALIKQDDNGFLVPVNDLDLLSKTMFKVLNMDSGELKVIGNNARESAIKYKPDVIYEEWKDFLQLVIN